MTHLADNETEASMTEHADKALRQEVAALLRAIDKGYVAIDMPDSAFVRGVRVALQFAHQAHGEAA
jgi:hypothetical protein